MIEISGGSSISTWALWPVLVYDSNCEIAGDKALTLYFLRWYIAIYWWNNDDDFNDSLGDA